MTDPIRPTPDEAAAIKAACESCVFYKCEYPGCEEPKGCVTPRIVRAALAADEAARAKAEPSADASYWATRAWIKAQGVLAQGGSGDAAVDQIALALESYAQRAKAEPQPSQSAKTLAVKIIDHLSEGYFNPDDPAAPVAETSSNRV